MKYLIVGVGGVIGAIARFVAGQWAQEWWGPAFPYGTLLINASGSFILGLFATLALALAWDDRWRLLVAIGFVGAYTTFSTFEYDSFKLIDRGGLLGPAAWNIFGSVAAGLLCAYVGVVVARALLATPARRKQDRGDAPGAA